MNINNGNGNGGKASPAYTMSPVKEVEYKESNERLDIVEDEVQ